MRMNATIFWGALRRDPLLDIVGGQNLISSSPTVGAVSNRDGSFEIKPHTNPALQREYFFYYPHMNIGMSVSGTQHSWSVWLKPGLIANDGREKTFVHLSPHGVLKDPLAPLHKQCWLDYYGGHMGVDKLN